jgi:hypothetical protein
MTTRQFIKSAIAPTITGVAVIALLGWCIHILSFDMNDICVMFCSFVIYSIINKK